MTSYAINNAPTLYNLVLGNSSSPGGWQLDRDLLLPAGAIGVLTGNNGDCALKSRMVGLILRLRRD